MGRSAPPNNSCRQHDGLHFSFLFSSPPRCTWCLPLSTKAGRCLSSHLIVPMTCSPTSAGVWLLNGDNTTSSPISVLIGSRRLACKNASFVEFAREKTLQEGMTESTRCWRRAGCVCGADLNDFSRLHDGRSFLWCCLRSRVRCAGPIGVAVCFWDAWSHCVCLGADSSLLRSSSAIRGWVENQEIAASGMTHAPRVVEAYEPNRVHALLKYSLLLFVRRRCAGLGRLASAPPTRHRSLRR